MKTDAQAATLINRMADFFYVYFDQKTSDTIKRHPDRAIPMIKAGIQDNRLNKGQLRAYAAAMQDAAAYQSLRLQK